MGLNEDVAAYAQELADAAGITDATARENFLKNDKITGKLRAKFEEASREKGRADAERQARQKDYEANVKLANDNQAVVDEARRQVSAYEAKYGKLEPGSREEAVRQVAAGIDEKTFKDSIAKVQGDALAWAKISSRITASHLKEFNEVPDLDAIEKIAVEQGLNADKAYAEYVRPKREEREKASHEAALKKAREEGEVEGRSKSGATAVVDSEPPSAFHAHLRKSGQASEGGKSAFLSGWREAEQAGAKK